MTYRQARDDFEALERVVELHDQVELDSERLALMQQPTKAFAMSMYVSAIEMWFAEHDEDINETTREIAERHNIQCKPFLK